MIVTSPIVTYQEGHTVRIPAEYALPADRYRYASGYVDGVEGAAPCYRRGVWPAYDAGYRAGKREREGKGDAAD